MKTVFYLVISFFVLASCSDLKKSKQLASIDEMSKKLDKILVETKANKVDSARYYSIEAREIELRIKNNYTLDTVDVPFGTKMNRFKNMRRAFGKFDEKYENLLMGCAEIKESLRQLRHDINNGNGDRAKYDEYVAFEKNKFDQIDTLAKEYFEQKNLHMATFTELYKEIEDFSFKLFNENKKR